MEQWSDPVVEQYRRVAGRELEIARQVVDRCGGVGEMSGLVQCLQRVHDMAAMLRHRRTTAMLDVLFEFSATHTDPRVHTSVWIPALDAVLRLVTGGRPNPRTVDDVRAAIAAAGDTAAIGDVVVMASAVALHTAIKAGRS